MTHAYQEIYLSKAQSILGDAFDYAINICIIPGDSFVKLFVASTISRRMENGEPDYLAGKSGIEVAMDILVETTGKAPEALPQVHYGRSREYWIGWAVVYYQWCSGRRYSDIFFTDTNLKRIRTAYGCTQAELAKRSQVSLRSIQMYEQRNKDINKASAETVLRLSRVLGCTMEDLLEK